MSFYTNVTKYGNVIEYRGYDNRGKRVKKKFKFQPTLYFPTDATDAKFKSMDGKSLAPMVYETMADTKQDLNIYGNTSNGIVFGSDKFTTQFIQEMFPGEIDFNPDIIRIGTIDIEVFSEGEFPKPENANYPIVSICIHSTKYDEYYVLGTHKSQKYNKFKTELKIPTDKLVYLHCKNEDELLAHFLKLWTSLDLDVITGWFSMGFDIPYIVNRLNRLCPGSANALSPWGRVYERIVHMAGGKTMQTYDIVGLAHLDYMDVFKKFGYIFGPQESYRLDAIAYSILGEKKLDYSEYGNLTDLYKKNFHKYVDYNIRDVDLIVRMEKKHKLLRLAFQVAYMAGSSYADTLGTVSIWTSFIYRHMISKGIVPPAVRKDNIKSSFDGGYVKEPIPGSYNWVCSFDLDSLYPNLIVQYNMSPETIVGMQDDVSIDRYLSGDYEARDVEPHYAIAANGATFKKNKQGLIPEIVENLYSYRVELKTEMKETKDDNRRALLKNRQHAVKILLNSLYGAMSNAYFPYFDIRIAEAITHSGQLSIKWAARAANDFLNEGFKTDYDYIIAVDTDSIYVDLSRLVLANDESPVDTLDHFCNVYMQKALKDGYDELFVITNGYKQRMAMKREVIADRGLWTAKKRYILNVLDDEGERLDTPKLKVMGVEAVRSTTPEIIRDRMKETFRVLLTEDAKTAHAFMDEFKAEFIKLAPEDVCFPKSANNLEKYSDPKTIYRKGTPIQVRASLLYNDMLSKCEVGDKYREITSGDKIKYSYLREPNPVRENVIAFPDILPPEFGLHKYIDYEKQFSKGFTEPLRQVFSALDWSVDDYLTVDNFLE